jgi:hypothetical protein
LPLLRAAAIVRVLDCALEFQVLRDCFPARTVIE